MSVLQHLLLSSPIFIKHISWSPNLSSQSLYDTETQLLQCTLWGKAPHNCLEVTINAKWGGVFWLGPSSAALVANLGPRCWFWPFKALHCSGPGTLRNHLLPDEPSLKSKAACATSSKSQTHSNDKQGLPSYTPSVQCINTKTGKEGQAGHNSFNHLVNQMSVQSWQSFTFHLGGKPAKQGMAGSPLALLSGWYSWLK